MCDKLVLAQSYRRLFRFTIEDPANKEETHATQNRIDDDNDKLSQ